MARARKVLGETSEERAARLRRHGKSVWKAFCDRKEALRADGATAKEAYAKAAAEFTEQALGFAPGPPAKPVPPPSRQPSPDKPVVPASVEVPAEGRPDYIAIVDWVTVNLDMPREDWTIPIPAGALSMLAWAQRNLDTFYSQVVPKLLPSRSQLEVEQKFRDDGRNIRERLAEIRARAGQVLAIA